MGRRTLRVVMRETINSAIVAACCAAVITPAVATSKSHAQAISPSLMPPSASPRRALDSAALKFFAEWGMHWRSGQSTKLPAEYSRDRDAATDIASHERRAYLHCHSKKGLGINEQLVRLTPDYAPITSTYTAFSVCPTWPLDDQPTFPDEDERIDNALLPRARDQVTTARAKLLEVIEQFARTNPKDNRINGQRVRFLLDQGLNDSAYVAARACSADRWWCLMLQGYTEYRIGRRLQAEGTFAVARAAMTPKERCSWEDIGLLAPEKFFQAGSESECYGRDLFNKQYWWLSDPLWSVSGNERRMEHDARLIQLRLQSAFSSDGRINWEQETGSDAVHRMVVRYGWPSYLAWGGPINDDSHSSWLRGNESPERVPYTTYEYSIAGRVHTVPRFDVVANPFAASDSAWQLNRPLNLSDRRKWWPEEFMRRTAPLVQLPRGQTALLRRKSDIILALATDVAASDSAQVRDGSTGSLLASTGPDSIGLLATTMFKLGGTTFARGRVGPEPMLLGFEVRDFARAVSVTNATASGRTPVGADSVFAEARTRFAVTPPSTLDQMKSGEVAVSEAVLLRASDAAPPPVRGDSLLDQMLGSVIVNVKSTPKVGVYWETYGVSARDSVTIGVRVERRVPIGGIRKLGMTLRLADDPNSTVNITWREPDRGRITTTFEGTVPIQSRTVLLDLSRLEPGPYDLVMSVAKIRGPTATSVKRFVVAR